MTRSEGRQRKYQHGVLRFSDKKCVYIRKYFIILAGELSEGQWNMCQEGMLLTPTIAGSLGIGGWFSLGAAGPSSMRRSFTSLPRKTMKS